ncbi:hypothetical protein [Streptomyces scabiei]|uniref:hypothetical protein n=1 Tax=Streptomyces TaxID=1883 RepID=UPI0029B6BCCB|nr:hypothetical protein [Streptomyces scabiei]MDX3114225.1 hypothetical protein [Streptomyces scabiei]
MLSRQAGKPKPDVIEALISAVTSAHAEIDAGIVTTQHAFPVIRDRGFRAAQDNDGQPLAAG